jgi:NDP-sugar pyrophosphorylase family protein
MKVVGVVLAAGLGTRLRPSTDHCPKPLIPVGGIEPLFFAISKFRSLGIRRVVVNAHYLSARIEEALKRWAALMPEMEFRCVVEKPEILGTGGGIVHLVQANKDWFKDSGLLVQNGDTLAQFDLTQVLADQKQNHFAVSYNSEHLRKYNPLWVDQRGEWSGIGKVPPQADDRPAHFLGVYFLRTQAIQKLLTPEFKIEVGDLFNLVFRPLTRLGEQFLAKSFFASGVGSEEFWFDMTTQEFLLEAQRHVLSTLMSSNFWGQVLVQRYPNIQEQSRGVWVRCNRTSQSIAFHSPAIFVDDSTKTEELKSGPLVLGPNAALIFERGPIRVHSNHLSTAITNAVVFSGNRSIQESLPAQVQDQIVVI